ncbi:MAG: MGH1-like glycoside hydrolase domain-containing protein, partial [Thermoanaerobaculia bacterium]
MTQNEHSTAEYLRIHGPEVSRWRKWGPYLSDRAWGTVREDYSENGDAWSHLPHDLARSKAFRWGDDGIAGWCDRYQILNWGLGLWNERDPILKERYFGVVPTEGNHGEDVKEYYFYVDALPSHSYMRMIYKYPHQEYPYAWLIDENRRRDGSGPEFELIDTGTFDENRYFDIEIEIAKDGPDTVVFRVTAHNRGPDPAPIHLVPNLWFRNVWAWKQEPRPEPSISVLELPGGQRSLLADDSNAPPLDGLLADSRLGPHRLDIPADAELLFTNNDTNGPRVYGPWSQPRSPYVKDAFHRRIVNGESEATNPEQRGTKSCAHMRFMVPPGESAVMHMRLTPGTTPWTPLDSVDTVIAARKKEADDFYAAVQPAKATAQEKLVQRQAFAGMIWSKQSYLFDVDSWLDGDNPAIPPPESRKNVRNKHWRHLNSMRVLSMPDKWEYPWFAAWDLAFHMIPFARVDSEFAKDQLWLMLFEQFQHPNGQIPAYEWEFSDLNPPVHPWAVWRIYNMDRVQNDKADTE